MSVDDRIEDLLVQWEMGRLEGKVLSVAELCQDDPELVGELQQRVAVLQDLSWTLDPFELVDTSDEPDEQSSQNLETVTSDLTIAEFVETLSDSGILNDSEISRVQASTTASASETVQHFAQDLIEQNLLTSYQAKVILQRGDSPLLLDRYIILDSIGSGGMGIVFKALQRSLERVVAVKVLPKHAVDSAEKVERFQREIRTAAKLSHPNVVQAFDAHESNGVYFLAMEYVDGCDLAALVDAHGPLPVPDAVDIITQATAGLGCAHDLRIVHRDVKPANILLGADGTAKVLDLGLARTRELAQSTSTNDLTKDGLAMGTVNFMSPEQAFDAKKADERSDIYSLGCTLYYLLHGRPPFERTNSVQTVIAHREEAAPKLSEGREDVPAELESVFQRMMAKAPEQRPVSMAEVRSLLSSDVEAEQRKLSSANRRAAATPTAQMPSWLWLTAGILLLAVIVFFAAKTINTSSTRSLAETALRDDAVMLTVSNDEFEELEVGYVPELPPGDFDIDGATLFLDDGDNLNAIFDLTGIKTLTIVSATEAATITVDLLGLEKHPILTALHLTECELDEHAIAQIARCKNLTSFSAFGCKITTRGSLKQLKELPALAFLTLDGTLVNNDDLNWLKACDSLEDLDVSNTSVTEAILPLISELPNLATLHMTGLEISDPRPFESLDQLSALSLDATNLNDQHVQFLSKMENLRFLDVSHTELSASGVQEICDLPSLRYLIVQGLNIEAAIEKIAAIPNLTDLDARHTDLSDVGIQKLGVAKGLATLDVEGSEVSDAALDRLLRLLPSCSLYIESDMDAFDYLGK